MNIAGKRATKYLQNTFKKIVHHGQVPLIVDISYRSTYANQQMLHISKWTQRQTVQGHINSSAPIRKGFELSLTSFCDTSILLLG